MPFEPNRVALKYVGVDSRFTAFLAAVYGWMFAGLALTATTAYWVSLHPNIYNLVLSKGIFLSLCFAEVLIVLLIGLVASRAEAGLATVLFMVYAAINGVTLSAVFLAYTHLSILKTFIVCGGMFGITSMYGFLTKTNLTSLGHYLFMALIGLIIALFINMFFMSTMMDLLISCAGVIIFVGLTAYDTQKLGEMYDSDNSAAICAALVLYLDFINLFLFLLRFLGKSKD